MQRNAKQKLVAAFKPHSEGLMKLFGSLEASIIEFLWNQQTASARDVFEHLRDQGQRLSYGAVKTVLDRLVKKQFLVRSMHGNQYIYSPRLDREEFTRSAVREIIGSLFTSFGDPVYAQFIDHIQATDVDQLDRLTQLINEAEARKQSNV